MSNKANHNGKPPAAIIKPIHNGASNQQVQRLRFGEGQVKDLMGLIGVGMTGRFAPLKADVKKAIDTCPKDQFRIIYPNKEMLTEKVKRDGARMAVQKMLTELKTGWLIRWAPAEEVFVVVREEDWKKIGGPGRVK